MKKMLVLLVFGVALVVAVPSALFAQSSSGFTSYYKPGNVAATIEGGISSGYWGFGVAAYPSLEIILAKTRIGDYLPIDFGAEARGRLGIGLGSYSGFNVGVGGFGTAHFGFRGFPGDFGKFISKLDLYLGLGLTFNLSSGSYYTGLGFSSFAGLNYFLSDNLAIVFGESYWQNYDTTLGIRLKFGSAEQAKKSM